MLDFKLRKTMLFIEEIHHDGGPVAQTPRIRAAIIALVNNPFAGKYVEDIQPAMEVLKPLGLMMTDRLIDALGGRDGIDAFG
ncbi:MAG: amino acid synthesis family protein, partial [Marinosulfonomonas sp.]|nr:amino acid synthesis family protein [Marinosulfonomonas sp.]